MRPPRSSTPEVAPQPDARINLSLWICQAAGAISGDSVDGWPSTGVLAIAMILSTVSRSD